MWFGAWKLVGIFHAPVGLALLAFPAIASGTLEQTESSQDVNKSFSLPVNVHKTELHLSHANSLKTAVKYRYVPGIIHS